MTSVKAVSRTPIQANYMPFICGNFVSEGGLERPSWWYIPNRGIYHQPKVARRRCLGRHVTMGATGSGSLRYRDRSLGRMAGRGGPAA